MHMEIYAILGSKFVQSENPEVGGIWLEVAGNHSQFYCYFDRYLRISNNNVQMFSSVHRHYLGIRILTNNIKIKTQKATL